MKNKFVLVFLIILTVFSSALFSSCSSDNSKFTVYFNSNGGTEVTEVLVLSGEKIIEPVKPSKEPTNTTWYEFEYWYVEDEKVPFDFESSINSEITLNAKWKETVRKYSVAFKNYDGTILEVDSVEYNKLPEYNSLTPEKKEENNKKFIFSGWDKEIEKVTKDQIYTAQFIEVQAFCVTFEMEDGTVFQVKQFCVGEAYDFFSIVPKVIPNGKDFYGWMLKNNENVVFGKGSWEMEENITVVPLFKDEQSYSPIY